MWEEDDAGEINKLSQSLSGARSERLILFEEPKSGGANWIVAEDLGLSMGGPHVSIRKEFNEKLWLPDSRSVCAKRRSNVVGSMGDP